MRIHTGDLVVVISGKEKGKTGRVLNVLPDRGRLVVSGANVRTKFVRRTPNAPGQRLHFEGSMHASNVMLLDPKTKKRTRVGYRLCEGRKERFAVVSGTALLSGRELRKLVEEGQGKTGKAGKDGEERKKDVPTELKTMSPKRTPFWQRLGFGRVEGGKEGRATEGGGEVRPHDQSTRKAPTGER